MIVGRSNIVGKPMAMLLLQRNATVTICHSKTRDLGEMTRQADILVAAIGRARFLTGDMVKPGAVVIDVGINRLPPNGQGRRKLAGDVDFQSVLGRASHLTPVPGGVGPMTIAMLLENTVLAAERSPEERLIAIHPGGETHDHRFAADRHPERLLCRRQDGPGAHGARLPQPHA